MKTWFSAKPGRRAIVAFGPLAAVWRVTRWIIRTVVAQARSKGGGGWQQLTSPWGLLAKGYRTRTRRKDSNRFIVVRRDGRPMKQK